MVEALASTERPTSHAVIPERRVATGRVIGRVVFVAVGLLLLTAASLKLVGLNFSPFAQYGWLLTPTVQTAAVIWEIALGVWLLLNRSRFFAWLAALGTFSAFAIVSGYLGFLGQANCGCFGLIQASPWAAFAVDIAALALLAFAKPRWLGWGAETSAMKWLAAISALFAILAVICFVRYGSIEVALAKFRGETLIVEPGVLDLGTLKSGELIERTIAIRNLNNESIRIIGGTDFGGIRVTSDLPVKIDANETVSLKFQFVVPKSDGGSARKEFFFFTDSPKSPKIGGTAVVWIENSH